ncbi:MAG: hypothetical protein LC104_14510 [Bacteroidales bacterium]|nr:hypothetical protein [Bacteroidales bacterium]
MPPAQKTAKPAPTKKNEPTQTKTVINPDVQVQCIRFRPCGKILAAAGCDGTVRRWEISGDKPTELPTMSGHQGWTTGIAFHADRPRLVSADSWGKVIAWDDTAREPKKLWETPAHDGWIRKIDISPDGRSVLTCGSDGFARLWSLDTGKKTAEFACNDPVLAAAFHPSGKMLVTGTLHAIVTKWDLATKQPVGTYDAGVLYKESRLQDVGGVRCFAFRADGHNLYVGGTLPSNGGSVQGLPHILSFDWASGKSTGIWKGNNPSDGFVYDLLVRPQGEVVAVTSGQPGRGQLLFWTPGSETATFLTTKMPNCHSLTLHPDGVQLAVAATNGGSNGNGKGQGDYKANFSPIHFWTLPEKV